ncbi:MAG: hypothetical protein UU21_C0007G0039 [Candidatus Levybacteria bacterium GW2011_GWA2_40_8]|nr:MAG: hypothetical protein UU21_C0007G0039 [Candidatus Levybacteria bacterium GW2011_GWA2_40_8]
MDPDGLLDKNFRSQHRGIGVQPDFENGEHEVQWPNGNPYPDPRVAEQGFDAPVGPKI